MKMYVLKLVFNSLAFCEGWQARASSVDTNFTRRIDPRHAEGPRSHRRHLGSMRKASMMDLGDQSSPSGSRSDVRVLDQRSPQLLRVPESRVPINVCIWHSGLAYRGIYREFYCFFCIIFGLLPPPSENLKCKVLKTFFNILAFCEGWEARASSRHTNLTRRIDPRHAEGPQKA